MNFHVDWSNASADDPSDWAIDLDSEFRRDKDYPPDVAGDCWSLFVVFIPINVATGFPFSVMIISSPGSS